MCCPHGKAKGICVPARGSAFGLWVFSFLIFFFLSRREEKVRAPCGKVYGVGSHYRIYDGTKPRLLERRLNADRTRLLQIYRLRADPGVGRKINRLRAQSARRRDFSRSRTRILWLRANFNTRANLRVSRRALAHGAKRNRNDCFGPNQGVSKVRRSACAKAVPRLARWR